MNHLPANQDNRTPPGAPQEKIGLLAAWGEYPIVLARTLREQGYGVVCLGVIGHANEELISLSDSFDWIGLCKLGGAIRYFRRHGVRRVVMAGKLHKVELFQPWMLLRHLPDWRAIRRFYPQFLFARKDRKDNTLLGAIIDEFAMDGIDFLPPTDFVPELLVKFGFLTKRRPRRHQKIDIEFGWKLAKEIGRLDVGQTVVVKSRAPLAIEAIEGTDACIRRAGALCASGGFTVVKVAKPRQDMRFDVPTIGRGTIESIVDAGGSVLAVEADRTIIVNQAEVVDYANRHGVSIVALHSDGNCQPLGEFEDEEQAA